jgi:hypothetical protein
MPRLDLDPWERSAESALRFAFGMLAREVSVPSVFGSMLARGPMNNRELSRLDLRAQAAVLRQEVQALSDPVVKAWLVAYYLPKPVPERQPGGRYVQVDPWTTDRQNAVHAVAWWLMAQQGTGSHRIRGYQEMVAQYVLNRPSSRRLREMFKVDANTVKERRDHCRKQMEDLHKRSVFTYDARLVLKGVLGA